MSLLGDIGSFLKAVVGTFVFGMKNAPLVYMPIFIFIVLIIILFILTGRRRLSSRTRTNFSAEPNILVKKKLPPRPPLIK